MNNPTKPKSLLPIAHTLEVSPSRRDVVDMVEELLKVLERCDADADDGVRSLLTAFMHGAHRVLDGSELGDTEQNRDSLLIMLEQATRTIETWPLGGAISTRVH